MVQQLYNRKQLVKEQRKEEKGSVEDCEESETLSSYEPEQKLELSKVNILKSNLGFFIPKCKRLLKSEEQLFVQGLKLYHKRINLTNFLKKVDEIEGDLSEIKLSLN